MKKESAPAAPLDDFLRDPRVRRWGPALLIALLAFVFFMPTLRGMYIWDDGQWLLDNPSVKNPYGLGPIWTNPDASPHYYPLVFTTFWLEYRLWGLGTMGADGVLRGVGYHADNLLMHIGSALVIFATLKRLKLPGGELGAWLAAAVFAIHPVNVESVAWVAERKNCLCGIFFFTSMLFGLRFFGVTKEEADAQEKGTLGNHWGWYAVMVVCFVAAMLAKTVACVLPPALLLMIWWRRGKIQWREIGLTAPLFVIAVVMGLVTASAETATAGAVGPEFAYSWLQRVLIAGNALWFYVAKLLVPNPVMQIYPRFPIVAGQAVTQGWLYLAPPTFAAFLLALFFLRKRITRGPVTAMLFFAGALFPALGFFNFYTMVFTFVADHYQYLACVGVIVLVVETLLWGIRKLPQVIPTEDGARFVRLTTFLVVGGIVLSLGTLSYGVSNLYTDNVALWVFNADKNPKSFYVWNNIAMTHLSVNPPDHKAAEQAYLKSIEVEPNDWRAYHQLGMIYLVDNVPDKAAKFLDRAEQLMPDFVRNGRVKFLEKEASDLQERTPQSEADGVWDMAHGPEYLLARNYEDHAAWDQAITGYKADLQKYPDDAAAYFGLGNCYVGKNDFNAAVESYNSAIKLKPKYAAAYLNMGLALGQLHRDKEAMDALQTARRLDPMVLRHVPGLLKAVAEQMRDAKK